MQNIRTDMLLNKRLDGCRECHLREESGVRSLRTAFNLDYGHTVEPELRYIEFNLGNLCNLKCRMCGSWSSSKWAADEIALGLVPGDLVRPQISLVLPYVDTIDKIRFIGGEPSLEQDAIVELLTHIRHAKGSLSHLRVDITTNCMVLLEPRLIDLLSQCRRVELQCSIDGFDKVNDYQRTGADWLTITHNLKWYQENLPPVCETMILTSWTILNVNSAIQFMSYVEEQLPRFYVWGHLVRDPAYLDLRNAPADMKNKIIDLLEQWKTLDHLHWIIHNKQVLSSQLQREPLLSCDQVLACIARLDSIRQEDFAVIDPEIHQALVAACKKIN